MERHCIHAGCTAERKEHSVYCPTHFQMLQQQQQQSQQQQQQQQQQQ